MKDSQTPQEKRALKAIWDADPRVVALNAAVQEHVRLSTMPFGVDAMTDAIQFAGAWVREHGPLPDSGIICS